MNPLASFALSALLLGAAVPPAGRSTALTSRHALDARTVVETLDREGRVLLKGSQVLILSYDYTAAGDTVEAIAFRPAAEGAYPAIMLIPGYSKSARDYIPIGVRLAKEGFACLAATQRGFGRSTGEPDFVGPKTMAALEAGFRKFREEPYVDPSRMGLFGYSRGAMAASLLAVRLRENELRAAVFASGIYDFRKAYEEIAIAGIRENMEREAGLSGTAAEARSSISKMVNLPCPVLILHGEKDANAPVDQAYALRDRLESLGKPHELRVFPDRDHDLGRENLYNAMIPFFEKTLKGEAARTRP